MDPKQILSSVGESLSSLFHRKTKTEPVRPPRLTSPVRFPYGPFQFKFQMPKGISYEIQASTNLQAWQPVFEGKSSGEVDYVDSEASKLSYRFYRVLAEKVLSANAVGYVTINAPPGYSMIANPLQAVSNTLSAILPNMADGTALNKFDNSSFRLTENSVTSGNWANLNETLSPGEGAIFFNPTSDFRNINFAGEVPQGTLLLPIAAGFSVRSSQIPRAGRLHSDLGFPIAVGDVIHLFDRDRQKYVIYEYDAKKWDSDPPILGVGESFWIGKTTPGNWIQTFTLR
jgi:hypothetical protein